MANAESTLILAEGLSKEYALGEQLIRALAGVDLAIGAGEFVALAGPSGSGKSTLLNVLGGLDRPTAGQMLFAGDDITGLRDRELCHYRRRQVGFVFQHFNLLDTRTALENVEFPLVFAGISERERRDRATRAMAAVGLADRLHHRPNELSGGQQQRVAIARALVHDPPLILADEPTGNLDTATSLGIMRLLAELNRQGRTVVVVTHDPRMMRFAHRTLHLLDGRIVPEAEHHAAIDHAILDSPLQ